MTRQNKTNTTKEKTLYIPDEILNFIERTAHMSNVLRNLQHEVDWDNEPSRVLRARHDAMLYLAVRHPKLVEHKLSRTFIPANEHNFPASYYIEKVEFYSHLMNVDIRTSTDIPEALRRSARDFADNRYGCTNVLRLIITPRGQQ